MDKLQNAEVAVNLYEELVGLIDGLNACGIDYAICGGIAVALHGYPRFTKDIDLLILAEDLDRILALVETQQFTLKAGRLPFDIGGPNERMIYRVSKLEGEELLSLDLLLVNANLKDAWDDREVFSWHNRTIQIVSAAGLATMKRMAGRPQDLLDLEKLGLEYDGKD